MCLKLGLGQKYTCSKMGPWRGISWLMGILFYFNQSLFCQNSTMSVQWTYTLSQAVVSYRRGTAVTIWLWFSAGISLSNTYLSATLGRRRGILGKGNQGKSCRGGEDVTAITREMGMFMHHVSVHFWKWWESSDNKFSNCLQILLFDARWYPHGHDGG